jgi:hypothetical protein
MSAELPSLTPRFVLRARGRRTRRFAAILLGLQALLWGGGSILEARAAAESLTRHAHVEDTGSTTCPPIHSHLDCLVCRTLSNGALGGSAPSVRPTQSVKVCLPEGPAVAGLDYTARGPLGSRAPPSA